MPQATPTRLLDRVRVLKYATVDKAPTYRAVVQVLFEAKQRYQIELRPADMLETLQSMPVQHGVETLEELDLCLDQLVKWENLAHSHDTAAATSLAEYNRRRYLYRLTAAGEAAHRAVLEVEATIGRSGSLQSEMLQRIRDALQGLAAQALAPVPDGQQVVGRLHELHAAFDSLTREATCFISQLTRHLEDQRVDEERYQLHKQAVLDYISTFVDRLRRVADQITGAIRAVDRNAIIRLLEAAVPHAELPPELDGEDPRARWIEEQGARWSGVAGWFVGVRGEEATVARLERAAVEAVLRLTRALARLNDRRGGAGDRAAGYLDLARRFAACADDDAAHQLWQVVFGLHAARHFHLAEEDEELVRPGTSWWDAEPVAVPVRLRTAGRTSNAGRPSRVADHSQSRAWIAQMQRRDRAQREAARRRFVDRGPLRLSQLGRLDAAELELLLELLDEGLGAPRREGASSRDGQLTVILMPPASDGAEATIETPLGRLRCRDWALQVESAGQRALRQNTARRQGGAER